MQHILITGCSSGIGLTSAQYLKEKGFQVYPTARKSSDIKYLQSLGFDAIYCDMCDSLSIEKAVAECLEKSDHQLSAIINNAGYVEPGSCLQINRAILHAQFDTNVFGAHELTRVALPHFLKQGFGRVIYVSSVLGLVARTHLGAYNASKYAVEGLADTLRLELSQHPNIHVSLIEPGPIASKISNNAMKAIENRQQPANQKGDHQLLEAMRQDPTSNPFQLPPEAVAKAFYHAINSHRPRIRYPITKPAKLASIARRLLPDRLLDNLLTLAEPASQSELLPPPQ